MKHWICIAALIMLYGCTSGILTTYDSDGRVLSTNKYCNVAQVQVVKDSATIYSSNIYGSHAEIPLLIADKFGVLKFTLGYMSSKQGIIPRKADGELPNVLIDIATDKDSMSDTYSTGGIATQIYPQGTYDEENQICK